MKKALRVTIEGDSVIISFVKEAPPRMIRDTSLHGEVSIFKRNPLDVSDEFTLTKAQTEKLGELVNASIREAISY